VFQNIVSNGSYKIEFTSNPTKTYKNVKFTDGKFDGVCIDAEEAGVRLSGESPFRSFRVRNSVFYNIPDHAVKIDYNTTYDRIYDIISVDNNIFSSFAVPNKCGVLMTDYNYASRRANISVEDNDFTNNTGLTGTNKVEAAVKFDATCGEMTNNAVSGSGYANGLVNIRTDGVTNLTNTLFCYNRIANCSNSNSGKGIWTDFWEGYVKSNRVSTCDIGFQSGSDDNGHLIYSNINSCSGPGLKVLGYMDLSGVPDQVINDVPVDGYSAYDTLSNNNSNHSTTTGQIEVANGQTLILSGGFVENNMGKNNIITSTTNSNDYFIYSPSGSSTTDLHVIDIQYWADPNGYYIPAQKPATQDPRMPGTDYRTSYTLPSPDYGTSYFYDNAPSCSGGIFALTGSTTQQESHPRDQSASNDDVADSERCAKLYKKGNDAHTVGQHKLAYDTLRYFIEQCANQDESYLAFRSLTGAVTNLAENNKILWSEYRQWLLAVLYLNTTNPRYYCEDVNALKGTFSYVPGRGLDYNGLLAMVKYLVESNKCPDFNERWMQYWDGARAKQYENWQDSVTVDTMLYKMDTTLPSLEELGLGILRQNPNAGVKPAHFPEVTFGEITASNNPFREETYITLEMQKLGLVKFELLNELGQVVQQNGIGRVIEKGHHRIPIDGSNLASGTYYARFSSSDGQTKTLKLKHIK